MNTFKAFVFQTKLLLSNLANATVFEVTISFISSCSEYNSVSVSGLFATNYAENNLLAAPCVILCSGIFLRANCRQAVSFILLGHVVTLLIN